jgi:Protein of unknown function (DUF3775)
MPLAENSVDTPVLAIPTDKVGFIIVKAREFDEKVADSDPDEGSNPTDDANADILEDKSGDGTREELAGAIRALNDDEQVELVALAWIGRGTYDLSEWPEALQVARDEHGKKPATYLLGLPMLGDYLEEGLAAFGETISDEDAMA